MSPIRVVVVDDHDLLREGVTACLAGFEDLEVVGEAGSGEAAIEVVTEVEPDVLVIDLVMPGIGGVEAIRRLRAANPSLGIVALSSFSDGERIREVIDAGATGYMVKSVDADSLARAVRGAASGEGMFSPEVTRSLMQAPPAEPVSALTARENEIADLIAEGRTNAEIANGLHLSIFTVKNHVSSILMKLAVRTRTEVASVILKSRQ
jgi:NarL family two-component system response regulator LiaR